MRRHATAGVVALAVLAVSVATTLAPLHWSPYPSTLDGLGHARIARDIVAAGQIPVEGLRADHLVPPVYLAMASEVVGVRPVLLVQALFSLVGAALPLFGVAFVGRLARAREWSREQYKVGAVLAGLALAVDGLLVRRIGAPDSDVFTLLMVPLVTMSLFWYVRTGRRAWLSVAVVELVVLPLTHTFSTLVAALSITAVAVVALSEAERRRRALLAAGVVAGFWGYFAGYYELVPALGMTVPYVERVFTNPGLFLAWAVLLVLGVRWYRRAGTRSRTAAFLGPFALFFVVFAVNAVTTVFPGTASTPPFVLRSMLPLAVPVFAAGLAAPLLGERNAVSPVLLAMVAATVVVVCFSLSAALTPEYMATAMRGQSFAHLSVFVLAGAGMATALGRSEVVTGRRESVRVTLAFVVLFATALSLPVAFVTLDTGAFPKGTHSSEFATATFVAEHVDGPWTSDHKQTRIAGNYYPTSGSISPTMSWLGGAPPPDCPMVTKRSWTTTGAHLFPLAPRTVSPDRFERTLAGRNVIYTATGYTNISVSVPSRLAGAGGEIPGC